MTFEPGARTAWHAHALGQTLIVTAGCGRVQRWGGPDDNLGALDIELTAADLSDIKAAMANITVVGNRY